MKYNLLQLIISVWQHCVTHNTNPNCRGKQPHFRETVTAAVEVVNLNERCVVKVWCSTLGAIEHLLYQLCLLSLELLYQVCLVTHLLTTVNKWRVMMCARLLTYTWNIYRICHHTFITRFAIASVISYAVYRWQTFVRSRFCDLSMVIAVCFSDISLRCGLCVTAKFMWSGKPYVYKQHQQYFGQHLPTSLETTCCMMKFKYLLSFLQTKILWIIIPSLGFR